MKRAISILILTASMSWAGLLKLDRNFAVDTNNNPVLLNASPNADGSFVLGTGSGGTQVIKINPNVMLDTNNTPVRLQGTLNADGSFTLNTTSSGGGGGGAPSGPAGGILGGTYPNPSFGTFTSSTLASAISDETGTGSAVFSNSPTLVTPALGTPASGVATNLTGTASGLTAGNVTTNANLTGPITSTGNATSVASQTGTGSTFVMNTNPILVTPNIGTPSAGTLTNCTFPTLNQNTTGSAASLSITGQTALLTFTGPTSTNRAKVVRDAADTILELGGSYTPTGTWTNLTMVTPVLGTPTSGNLTNCTFPTLNQNTTGSAASLSVAGQTGLVTVTGITSTNRAKTVRDAADTLLELGGSYTPTGTWTSLTMVTPVLGTPTSGTLSNCTTATKTAGDNSTNLASTAYVDATAGGWVYVKMAADGTVTSTSLQSFTTTPLITTTLSNTTNYEVEAELLVTNAGDAAGSKVSFVVTGSPTQATTFTSSGVTTSANTAANLSANFGTAEATALNTTSSGFGWIKMNCLVTTGTSTTVEVQALKVTSGTLTIKAGSYIRYRKF